MDFVGFKLVGNQTEKVAIPEEMDLIISNIALVAPEGKVNTVSVKIGDETRVLCTLIGGRIPQYSLDLTISTDEEVELSTAGEGEVSIIGNFVAAFGNEDMDFDDEDDEDGDEDDEEMDDDSEELTPEQLKALKAKYGKGDDDDLEDDEDDEEEEEEEEKPAKKAAPQKGKQQKPQQKQQGKKKAALFLGPYPTSTQMAAALATMMSSSKNGLFYKALQLLGSEDQTSSEQLEELYRQQLTLLSQRLPATPQQQQQVPSPPGARLETSSADVMSIKRIISPNLSSVGARSPSENEGLTRVYRKPPTAVVKSPRSSGSSDEGSSSSSMEAPAPKRVKLTISATTSPRASSMSASADLNSRLKALSKHR
eukprot:m51a1_g3298 hypothetical protein (367) ;mRNA; r:303021-305107